MTRLALATVALIALLAAGAVTALATPGTVLGHSSAAGSPMGKVRVQLKVNKFVKKGHRLVATGMAVATYTPKTGHRLSCGIVSRPVSSSAADGAGPGDGAFPRCNSKPPARC